MRTSARTDRLQPYHHGDLRRALVEAALDLVEEKGLSGFTMAEAARRAGVSVAAPYRHFANSDALVRAAATAGFDALHQALATAVPPSPTDPVAALAALAERYVEFALAAPAQFALMFTARIDKSRSADLRAAAERTEQELTRVVETLPDTGRTAAELTQAIWAIAHGVATLAVDGLLSPTGANQSSAALGVAGDLVTTWILGLGVLTPTP